MKATSCSKEVWYGLHERKVGTGLTYFKSTQILETQCQGSYQFHEPKM